MKECVLLTRPQGENELLASKLASSGWDVLVRPMLKIEGLSPRTQHLSNLTIFDKIISGESPAFLAICIKGAWAAALTIATPIC